MRIYDISQEVFGCQVYPGDPAPKREILSSYEKGDPYHLTVISMCAHNGTHIDAPYHFIQNGKTVEKIPLSQTVGEAFVYAHTGVVTASDADNILAAAQKAGAPSRILLKGNLTVSEAAAERFARASLCLLGNESQTVGPEDAPMAVHLTLLSAGIVLLEGIRLSDVPEGKYLLSAAPLSLAGADGAPCRALLIDTEENAL